MLFVCTGNICRSAFAEACLRAALGPVADVGVGSAGVSALEGHRMDPLMRREARARGLDGSAHASRQVTGRLLMDADVVLVFERVHVRWVSAEYPDFAERVVGLGQAAAVLRERPRRALMPLSTLAVDVWAERPEPADDDWIEDPYGRGPAAAAGAARRIAADVVTLVNKVEWGV